MTPEDIGDIFQALEDALFAMAIRTMKHHENWEQEEGFQWTQWQAEQIQGLRAYRQNVTALTDYYFTLAKQGIESYLRQAYRNSVDDAAETARTIMMQTGRLAQFSQQFFGVNSKKLDVLIHEAIQNIDTKRYAAINRMNTGYTDMLRKADIFAQSGSFTIPQAVDMAAKDFLSAGLNCVEYSNGNRVNIASYAEMALRTSSSEVTRQANGDVRDELGEYLVVSNVIGITCPICQKWQGKVLIDDVYASGKPDGKHKLVSQAKAAGFMHPNCRHQLYMYIPGLTEIADLPDTKITRERYKAEQQQRYQERQIRKYKRLREGAMDPGNRQKYDARVKEWTQRHNEFLEEHDYLRKNPKRLAPGYRITKPKSEDVTQTWSNYIPKGNVSVVEGKQAVDKNGAIFDYPGIKLKNDHSLDEKNIANIISESINSEIELVPRVDFPQGVSTPDFRLIRTGETIELKTINYPEEIKDVHLDALFRSAKKAKKQSSFVAIDVSLYQFGDDMISQQIEKIFSDSDTAFINRLMIIRNGKIISVHQRL
ncbi:MAG: hypothetical protein IK142_02630 [Clostridiales bacterium]|nr:hypothetical protein [Clostridiales bacterium]